MLLRNAWYIGAWADELGDKPLARRICGDPIVLFRDGSGPCRPLLSSRGTAASRQPRRGRYRVRLSRPRFQHGRTLRGHAGKKLTPQDAQVRSYPSVERDQLVWLWMGDPALADPARIVDFPEAG